MIDENSCINAVGKINLNFTLTQIVCTRARYFNCSAGNNENVVEFTRC